jgi:hypothetical protein
MRAKPKAKTKPERIASLIRLLAEELGIEQPLLVWNTLWTEEPKRVPLDRISDEEELPQMVQEVFSLLGCPPGTKLTVEFGTVDEFFERMLENARKMDRKEKLEPEIRLSIEE